MNSSEYLQEEQELLPVRWEINEFVQESEDLRADVERLEARLQRLQQRVAKLTAAAALNSEGLSS
jgi:ubiquinone biosynthesis protein UbiJ